MSYDNIAFVPNFEVVNSNVVIPFSISPNYDRCSILLDIPKAHSLGLMGQGIRIGIIDDGFTPTINMPEPVEIYSFGYEGDTQSHTSHGNLHMGIMAMQGKPFVGIVPKAEFVVCKYLGYKGGTLENLAKAIMQCIESDCDIISISSGVDGIEYNESVALALCEAINAVIPVHVSVGNSSRGVAFPANRPEALGIGAVDYEKGTPMFQNTGKGVKFVSFGVGIISNDKDGNHIEVKGTSFSSPISVGCGAIQIQAFKKEYGRKPNLDEYASCLKSYAVDLRGLGWDELTGYGLVTIDFVNDNFARPFGEKGIVYKGEIKKEEKPSGCLGFAAILLLIIMML